MNDVWQKIALILEKQLDSGRFQIWIKPLTGELEGNVLTLHAPNSFVAGEVEGRLYSVISRAAAEVAGQPVHVVTGSHRPQRTRKDLATEETSSPAVGVPDNSGIPGSPGTSGSTGAMQAGQQTRQHKQEHLGLPHLTGSAISTYKWRFSFEDFVVGPCNELAFVAARGLCQERLAAGHLFINSAPGLGKTHLLHAIGRNIASQSNKKYVRVGYLSAEEFSTEFVAALKAREMDQFKARYRQKLDVLLLEDIHFLQGKQKIQDELLSTLNGLEARACKVVLSSSFLPRELKDVDEHLASRLSSGFLATIDRPCLLTRRKILTAKAKAQQVLLPDDVTEFLAESITSDVRQLESCLQNLVLKAQVLGRAVSMEMASGVVHNYTATKAVAVGLHDINRHICDAFALSAKQLCSKSRRHSIVLARNIAFYLARTHTDLGLKQIGAHFNRRHSTVFKGITSIEQELAHKTPLATQIQTIVDTLTSD